MSARTRLEFERLMLPHLGAAYSLARWLLRQPHDAEDAVQDAMLKAFKAFHGYAGGNARAWLLAIVRNTSLSMIERRRSEGKIVILGEGSRGAERPQHDALPDPSPLPDVAAITLEEARKIRHCISALPLPFREVLVLREYHDLSYREIAEIVGAPVGTIMSRLARARERLATELADLKPQSVTRSTS